MRLAWARAWGTLTLVTTALLTGCFSPAPRNAVPPALVETASVAGYSDIRYWGDKVTPAFDTAVTKLYEAIKKTAMSGTAPQMLDKAASQDTILSLAARGVATLVKYQVLSNLRVFSHAMESSLSHFFFTAIPADFDAIARTSFDLSYAEKLYQCGYRVGLEGSWSRTPAQTPELETQPVAPDGSTSLGADDVDDTLCRP